MACIWVEPSEKPSVSLFVFYIDGRQEMVCCQCFLIIFKSPRHHAAADSSNHSDDI